MGAIVAGTVLVIGLRTKQKMKSIQNEGVNRSTVFQLLRFRYEIENKLEKSTGSTGRR